jgi:transposase-like protein
VDILIIYIDGVFFGEQCVIAAVGVDDQGKKHVLGIREGATENSAAVKDLLEDLVERGVNPNRRRLFVLDGLKALRAGINAVFGADCPVQRCRNHKLRNVLERLPEAEQAQARSLIRAAWKLDAKSGMARLEKLAQWLEREYPDAADSLREGMADVSPSIGWTSPFPSTAAWPPPT